MKHRKLRLAWSVGCGLVCLLLIVLWVRSRWYQDRLSGTWLVASSAQGLIVLELGDLNRSWELTSESVRHPGWDRPGLAWSVAANRTFVFVAHTTLAVLVALIAPLPWIRWRFSLRTLLVVATLIAILLGLMVHAMS